MGHMPVVIDVAAPHFGLVHHHADRRFSLKYESIWLYANTSNAHLPPAACAAENVR